MAIDLILLQGGATRVHPFGRRDLIGQFMSDQWHDADGAGGGRARPAAEDTAQSRNQDDGQDQPLRLLQQAHQLAQDGCGRVALRGGQSGQCVYAAESVVERVTEPLNIAGRDAFRLIGHAVLARVSAWPLIRSHVSLIITNAGDALPAAALERVPL